MGNKHRFKIRKSLAALFVAAALVVLALNYTSPVGTRTFSSIGLRTAVPVCSTQITIPQVGVSYEKPDSIVVQLSIRAPSPHAAPACSVFASGCYGSPFSADRSPWAALFRADSGLSYHSIGRPYAAYDYLWLKVRLVSGDTGVLNATCKYLGDLVLSTIAFNPTTVCTVHLAIPDTIHTAPVRPETIHTMPVMRETIVSVPVRPETIVISHAYPETISVNTTPTFAQRTIGKNCTLDANTDFYLMHSTAPGGVWLPRASVRTRPIYLFTDVAAFTGNLACQVGDSFANGTTTTAFFTHPGCGAILFSNGVNKWCFVKESL
jgi:hypothetical protein